MTNRWRVHFLRSMTTNLTYWLKQVATASESEMGKWASKQPTLYKAVALGLHKEQTQPLAAELMLQLFPLIEQLGLWRKWEPLFQQAATSNVAPQQQYHLLIRHGQLLRRQNCYETAVHQHQQAQIIAETLSNPLLVAQAHFNLSAVYYAQQNYKLAEQYGLQAVQQFRTLEAEPRYLGATLMTLGMNAGAQGNYELAIQRLQQAVSHWRQTTRLISLARALNALANLMQANQTYDKAINCYDEAITILQTTASTYDTILTYNSKGALLFNLGQLDDAARTFLHAYRLAITHVGFNYYTAVILMNLANIRLLQKNLTQAKEHIQQSIRLWEQLQEDDIFYGNTLSIRGEIETALGHKTEAIHYFEHALTILSRFPANVTAQRWHKNTKQLLNHLHKERG